MALAMKGLAVIAACLGLVAGQALTFLNEKDSNIHPDCHSLYKAGYVNNGTYRINIEGQEYFVPCEFRDGFGFTIFLNRVDSYVNWGRNWNDYKTGFGHPAHDYFSGLYLLHQITHNTKSSLEVYFIDWDNKAYYAKNGYFHVGDETTGFQLSVGGVFEGSVGNDMIYNNGQQFYTLDHPDPHRCVNQQRGGWWYYYCSKTLPTGHYYTQGHYHVNQTYGDGIYWSDFKGPLWSLKRFVMALRPTV